MKLYLILVLPLLTSGLFGQEVNFEPMDSVTRHWVCNGYCFLGGDVPVNPFQPVSSTGATEEEARKNIDCGPYQETDIVCSEATEG